MTTPRAFISYSHDSITHKQWVLILATRLREAGVDAILDLWELQPGADLPAFMEKNLATANRVIMVCTDSYVAKANAGTGGVGYEKMIVTADLLKNIDSNKIIPIIRQGGTHNVPTFLRSKVFLDFSREEQFEFSFDELTRTLHNSPLFVKPPIGDKPFPTSAAPPKPVGDPIFKLIGIVVRHFEANPHTDYLSYSRIAKTAQGEGISRLYLDVLLKEAVQKGLITLTGPNVLLTTRGKYYAMENSLG
jgi:hypothetical protein